LEARVEATCGYGPGSRRLRRLHSALKTNPKLRNDLNVTRYMERSDGQLKLEANPDAWLA
jgi:hypothetical protein